MLGNNTVVFCRVIYICIDKVYKFMIVTLETIYSTIQDLPQSSKNSNKYLITLQFKGLFRYQYQLPKY
jgi:hypothetical protein